jgi:hypothetical protein
MSAIRRRDPAPTTPFGAAMSRAVQRLSFWLLVYHGAGIPAGCALNNHRSPDLADVDPTPSSDDFEILELVLLDLIDHGGFRPMARRDGKRTKIALSDKTVGQSAFLNDKQIPKEIRRDLRRRNPKTPISLARFQPKSDNILVEDLTGLNLDAPDFENRFPDVSECVEAWLPGYSKDGKQAAVMIQFGPSMATYLLVNEDGRWKVKQAAYII